MNKLLISLFLILSCPNAWAVFPDTTILDTATRTNEGPPPSANWSTVSGSTNNLKVSSNTIVTTGFTGPDAAEIYWNPSQFGPNIEVYVTLATINASRIPDVILLGRFNSGTGTGYAIETNFFNNTIQVYRLDPSETQLGADLSHTFSSGDSIGMSIVGSIISVYFKTGAGAWTSLGTRTDTTYSNVGYIGLGSYVDSGSTSNAFTNFGGGTANNGGMFLLP